MSQLLTQCPFCQTTFKVSDAQMQAANGVVRCGACMEVFLASQHRVILRERPAPQPVHEPELPDPEEEPQWQVVDNGEDSPGPFASWEEEESWRDTGEPAVAGYAGNDDDYYDDEPDGDDYAATAVTHDALDTDDHDDLVDDADDEPALDAYDHPDEDSEDDWEDDWKDEPEIEPPVEPAPPGQSPERPAYSGLLNPAGYAITQFSVDSLLSGIFRNTGGDREQEDSDEDAQATDDIPVGEQFPRQPVAAKTAVIVPARAERIPTLEPDMVAREEIPASAPGAQTLNWFQSLRQTLRDNRARKTAEETDADMDEKAEIRRRLMSLRDEDSLEPVDSAHLEALAAEPVELQGVQEQWQRLKGPGLIAAGVFLVLVLAGQYFWFNLDRLVLDRRMSAVTGLLCRVRTCPDASTIDLSAIVTEELVVRSHPARAEALQVDFIFRNDKNREQRFPLVELNFTDNAGDVIANRVFSATEYLPEEMQLFTHMPAHSSIQASLELVDPGANATGYSLIFRNP